MNAGSGNDLVDLSAFGGSFAFANGDEGDDILIGSRGNDTLNGGPGADFLHLQQGGNDLALGQDGNDVFYFGPALTSADKVDGGGGTDQLALRGPYTITFGEDQLAAVEQIGLVSAFDTRFGPADDPYQYNLTMSDGNVAGGARMTVDAAPLRPAESLTFNGGAETDGSFLVFGGQGADFILGGQNGDSISGGPGSDTLFGNAGNDVFRYTSTADSTPAAQDLIRDFAAGDLVDLSRVDADSRTEGNQAFTFIGAGAFGGRAGELRLEEQRAPIWLVQGDTDGDGSADFELLLVAVGRHAPASGDFIL
ncbi:MAG TPA: M10 family metallopeptidase C-terminal domain-containing protein [Allosphingosinicella sp.]